MDINLILRVRTKNNGEVEKQIEGLKLRTEIGRKIEEMGYKNYELFEEGSDPKILPTEDEE